MPYLQIFRMSFIVGSHQFRRNGFFEAAINKKPSNAMFQKCRGQRGEAEVSEVKKTTVDWTGTMSLVVELYTLKSR